MDDRVLAHDYVAHLVMEGDDGLVGLVCPPRVAGEGAGPALEGLHAGADLLGGLEAGLGPMAELLADPEGVAGLREYGLEALGLGAASFGLALGHAEEVEVEAEDIVGDDIDEEDEDGEDADGRDLLRPSPAEAEDDDAEEVADIGEGGDQAEEDDLPQLQGDHGVRRDGDDDPHDEAVAILVARHGDEEAHPTDIEEGRDRGEARGGLVPPRAHEAETSRIAQEGRDGDGDGED